MTIYLIGFINCDINAVCPVVPFCLDADEAVSSADALFWAVSSFQAHSVLCLLAQEPL